MVKEVAAILEYLKRTFWQPRVQALSILGRQKRVMFPPENLDRHIQHREMRINVFASFRVTGPTNVSIGDICNLTGAPRPGAYREFGSDDGLKTSALEAYHSLAVQPLIEILEKDQSATDAIDELIGFMTQDRTALGIPLGCLFIMMRAHTQQLGPSTCKRLREIRHDLLSAYEAWITRSKSRGEFADIPTHVAALFCDTQHGGAMRMQRECGPNDTVVQVLEAALRVLGRK